MGENMILLQAVVLKGMAVVYLSAFVSLFMEISQLIGTDGLLPAQVIFDKWINKGLDKDMSKLPTILWWAPEANKYLIQWFPSLAQFDAYDNALHIACVIGMVVSLLALISNKFISFWSFFTLWSIYLSVCHAGQLFFQFQWDSLLCEVGFLVMFFCPSLQSHKHIKNSNLNNNPSVLADELSVVVRHLLKWVAFRLNYASGITKLTSGCPTWWNLTALHHHFQTQPLPTPLAWYFHNLPSAVKKLFVAQNFITLIGCSLLLYVPYRRFRLFGMVMLISEQLVISLTGNFNFFNLLTTLTILCASDDEFIRFAFPRWFLRLLGVGDVLEQDQNSNQFSDLMSILRWIIECLVFVLLLVYCYYRYFPLESILGDERLPFNIEDVKVHLVNGFIPILALVAAALSTLNSLFHYSLKAKSENKQLIPSNPVRVTKRLFAIIFAFVTFTLSSFMFYAGIDRETTLFPLNIPSIQALAKQSHPFQLANSYGLFRMMTGLQGRDEFIFEVSADGVNYKEIDFFYKPGNLQTAPSFSVPYHPRLEWQIWFSSMKDYINEAYLANLVFKLLENKPSALALTNRKGIDQSEDIQYLSIHKYKYWFTSPQEFQETGNWWKRQKVITIAHKVRRGQDGLEESLSKFLMPIDKKKHALHPLRGIPVLPIIWATLLISSIRKLFSKRQ